MERLRDRQAEKRRDLARSTCSPTKGAARNARAAKRNANRRERRAQKTILTAARKAECLCDVDVDVCPRCDMEMLNRDKKTSRPKFFPWHYNLRCWQERRAWDKLSQIHRWARARHAELSNAELLCEFHNFGRKIAYVHAISHLSQRYELWKWWYGECEPESLTLAAFKSVLREHGLAWCEDTTQLLTEVAERICTHGKFRAADRWSFDLCDGLIFDGKQVRNGKHRWRYNSRELCLPGLDEGWWVNHEEKIGYRPLRGIEDAARWAAEIQRLFDLFWGPRFLETPEGRWVIGELVRKAIPVICIAS